MISEVFVGASSIGLMRPKLTSLHSCRYRFSPSSKLRTPSRGVFHLAEVHVNEVLAVLVDISPAIVGWHGRLGWESIRAWTLGLMLSLCPGSRGHARSHIVLLAQHTLPVFSVAHAAVLGFAHLSHHDDRYRGEWGGDGLAFSSRSAVLASRVLSLFDPYPFVEG